MLKRRNFLRGLFFGLPLALQKIPNHTLVCVFLRGGADTLNMLVPFGDDNYYSLRPTLAIPQKNNSDSVVKLNDFYGLHPKMSSLYPAFSEGRFAAVQAVGSDNTTGSHFEAQDQMEHGEAQGNSIGGGWLGRHLRSFPQTQLHSLSAIAIGSVLPESLRGAPTAMALESLAEINLKTPSENPSAASAALAKLYGSEVGVLGMQGKETLDLVKRVRKLQEKEYRPENKAEYSKSKFSKGLREIARLIKAQVGLQVACIDLGGWDTHFFQGSSNGLQAQPISTLAEGLATFDQDLKNYRTNVTTLVFTEFGRRIYENSSLGTDHGRGFTFFALGEGIQGGKIHGSWPGLEEEESEDLLGPGGLKVKIDYRTVLGEVLTKVMGNPDIEKVFPGFPYNPIGLVK